MLDIRTIALLCNALIFKDRPLYVHYGITHRCNVRCKMCRIYRDADRHSELSLKQIERIFDFLKRLGIIYVSIGGGEPFLREDLCDVVSLFRRKGLMVRLLTNGALADADSIKRLVSAGLRDVSISLDTLEPEKQDYIYDYKGAFDKIMESMDLFSELVPKNGRILLINTVVSPLNIRELPQLANMAQRKGFYISFIPVENNGLPEFTFTPESHRWIDESYDCLIGMKKGGRNSIFNSLLFLQKSKQYLKTGQCNWECDAGKLYFSINPEGGLSICHRFKPEISLLEDGHERFLNSEKFKDKCRDLAGNCPGCMRPCWAEISFLLKDRQTFWDMMKIKSRRRAI